MFQRMKNYVTINVPDVDLTTVSNIEVSFEQRSTEVELTYSGDSVSVSTPHSLVVAIPKEDAMQLDQRPIRGQVMFMRSNGYPDATKIFQAPVGELLKEDGYGD
jgi:hypothetical protein